MATKPEPAVTGFLAAEELGEVMLMRYGRVDDAGELVEWDFVPHVLFDGLGGYAHMLKTYEGHEMGLVKGRETKPPPLGKILAALRDALAREKLSPHRPAVPWKRYERGAIPGIPRAVGWAVLNEEESKLLAARHATSMNSRLMWSLDRVASSLLVGPHPPRLWLMPVNMRGASEAADRMKNPVCAVPIEFQEGSSAVEVHAAIKEKFEKGAHWGTWYLGMLRSAFGANAMRSAIHAYYNRPRHAWMGTFSNLGDWSVAGKKPNFFYIGVPPVTITNPLTGAVMGWGGRLTLTLQAHAAIANDPKQAMEMAAEWKRLALEASAT
jgi:hypothetical protein